MQLDDLDQKAASAFTGHVVRKDLVRRFRGQFPVPTYVVEFMLGRYCASTDQQEIDEGLQMVQSQLSDRTVRAGEEELFKARARERGSVRIIDIVTARLDAKSDSYLASLPSLRLTDVRIPDKIVQDHERMLTGGFYAEIELGYDGSIAQEKGGRPFEIMNLREIQLSTRDILEKVADGRSKLTTAEWKAFLLRSVGLEPGQLNARAQDAMLLRMVPFVESNYNLVELGPARHWQEPFVPASFALCPSSVGRQGDRRTHVCQHGERSTRPRLPVRRSVLRRGVGYLLRSEGRCQHHERLHGVWGVLAWPREHPRQLAASSWWATSMSTFSISNGLGICSGPMPPEMRNDTAFMDRIHCYLPGWAIPKISKELFTDRFRIGKRCSRRMLLAVTRAEPHQRPSRPGAFWRCSFRTRPECCQQDCFRVAEAYLSGCQGSCIGRGPRMGSSACSGSQAAREGATEARWLSRVQEHSVQLHDGLGRRREVRRHSGIAERG